MPNHPEQHPTVAIIEGHTLNRGEGWGRPQEGLGRALAEGPWEEGGAVCRQRAWNDLVNTVQIKLIGLLHIVLKLMFTNKLE